MPTNEEDVGDERRCKCGGNFIGGFEIQGTWFLLCEVCDEEPYDDDEEDPCSCYDGEINRYCRWCF